MENQPIKYWELSESELFNQLQTSPNGLSRKEAEKRLSKFGKNEVQTQDKRTALGIFISQFKNPLVLILLAASLIAGFLGEISSTVIIVLILLVSAVLGFIQEYKSENIINELRKKVALKTTVIREGQKQEIDATELVVGDIVLLGFGKVVPADLRLIATDDLMINEAMLTGESFPVEKKVEPLKVTEFLPQAMNNLAFMGTAVVQGSAQGIVVATSQNTELGKTANLLQVKPQQTDFQKGIADFGIFLFRIILTFCLLIFIFLAFLKHPWVDSLLFSLAIAVGISPELLPIIITINLSSGARKMAKKQVIVKRLMSIEDLGNTDILCTDKTGTLSEGTINLSGYFDFNNQKNIEVLHLALLCNSGVATKNVSENPLDTAIFAYAQKQNVDGFIHQYKIIDDISFDFLRRRMSVVVQKDNKRQLICKGAVEEVLSICSYARVDGKIEQFKAIEKEVKDKIISAENEGLRLLLLAYKDIETKDKYDPNDEKDLTLFGYLTFTDPPKQTAKKSLPELTNLGVQIKILTGDSELATKYLASEIGFKISGIILGSEIEKMPEEKLKKTVEQNNIFAKVTPEHKLRIINVLKDLGHTVSFLGDGVNDAPALRAADCGISVDTAVDVAKESADVILMQKDLGVILEGIIEGRKTFGNTLKYIFCTISSNFGNMFSVAGAAIILPYIPMLPVQILLLNFLSDFPMLAVASDEVDADYLKKPKHWDIKVIGYHMKFFGLISSVFDFITFGFLLLILNASPALFQAGWFWESYLTEVLLIFVVRTRKYFLQSKPSKVLIYTSIFTTILVLLFLYTGLRFFFNFALIPLPYLFMIFCIALTYFVIVEVGKKFFYKKFDI